MAKPKKPSKQDKPAGPAPAQPLAEVEDFDPSQADSLLAELFARHPPITDVHRAAFRSLITDGQADALGKRTRAADVRPESLRWAVQMDADLRAHPGPLRYTAARLVYYLECARALHEALKVEEDKRKRRGAARGEVELLHDEAIKVRGNLDSALRTFAGQREKERQDLKDGLGTADTNEKLVKSLTTMAKLGKRWLQRDDEISKILLETARLTPDSVTAAVSAAKSLHAATTGATLQGNDRGADSPATNRIEGRLVFEMMEARRAYNEANEHSGGIVRKLVPGPSIRHLFVRKTAAAQGDDDAGDQAEETPPEPEKKPEGK